MVLNKIITSYSGKKADAPNDQEKVARSGNMGSKRRRTQ
jgi:hypothetical protein